MTEKLTILQDQIKREYDFYFILSLVFYSIALFVYRKSVSKDLQIEINQLNEIILSNNEKLGQIDKMQIDVSEKNKVSSMYSVENVEGTPTRNRPTAALHIVLFKLLAGTAGFCRTLTTIAFEDFGKFCCCFPTRKYDLSYKPEQTFGIDGP